MQNSQVIKERLAEIDENMKILTELKAIEKKKFTSDPKSFKLAQYCLQVSIQAILDICHYIIATNNWQRPQENREAIIIIGDKGIIPTRFAKKIEPMASLRNLLVHEYAKINPRLIYQHLKRLDDFRKFQQYILTYLKKHKS
jgi:uncharacterized protein YutE (UPF0331/DUF86 family)